MKNIKTIGILGYGSFGSFIEIVMKKQFPKLKIKIYSRNKKTDKNEESIKKFYNFDETIDSDFVFLAIPISKITETIKKINKNIKNKETIFVDISTVKEMPEKEFKKYNNLKYINTHPMFGPYSYEKIGNNLNGLKIILTGHNLKNKEYKKIKEILKNLKLNIVEKTAEEHDKKLAETLFLTHFIAQTIVKAGYERTDIDTLSFGFLMDAVESVRNDKKLFLDVYKYNKFCKVVDENIWKSAGGVKEFLVEESMKK